MYNVILFDGDAWQNLLPLTFTRPIADLRIGILTISEKWQRFLKTSKISFSTQNYLSTKFPADVDDDNLLINATVLPSESLADAISSLKENESLYKDGELIAWRCLKKITTEFIENPQLPGSKENRQYNDEVIFIRYPWDIFKHNGVALECDFQLITKGRKRSKLSSTLSIIGNPDLVFAEEGAVAEHSILNTTSGPVYLASGSEIMEGSVVRGALALCEGSALKLSTKIYGPTTIGPHSKVGGEINNSVIQGFSNKAHDGFLGNSVIGEWCNIGADTNNSNLKNNYAEVKVWSYSKERFAPTGLQFCGLIMGDHSKCGINTMFNTGTAVGVSANIFGGGFPRTFIPSFTWGGAAGFTEYKFEKAMEVAKVVMSRRGVELEQQDLDILQHIFINTQKYRSNIK